MYFTLNRALIRSLLGASCLCLPLLIGTVSAAEDEIISKFKQSCEAGSAEACRNLGICYDRGDGVAVDDSMSAAYYEKACTLKDGFSCMYASMAYSEGRGVTQDVAHAQKLRDTGCALYPEGVLCEEVADEMAQKDAENLFNDNLKECENKNGSACNEVSLQYRAGDGVDINYEMSIKYAHKACDLEFATACSMIAEYYLREGEQSSAADAFAFYVKGCEFGDALACNKVAESYINGSGVDKDAQMAISYYEKGCNLDEIISCQYLYNFYEVDGDEERLEHIREKLAQLSDE